MCHAVSPRRSRVSVYADSRGGTKQRNELYTTRETGDTRGV